LCKNTPLLFWALAIAMTFGVSKHAQADNKSAATLSLTQSRHTDTGTDHATSNQQTEYEIVQDRPDRLLVKLPNRMIVIAQEVRTSPVVSAQVWVKTGSIYEQEHVGAGLSHFLEHLISGGTTGTRTEAQSNAILGQIGAQTNAATSLDTVRYYINTTRGFTDQAIDLLSDWMQHSLINEQEYQRERSVIQREFEMGQGEPNRILWKLTQQARYKAHPAKHPTIGYLDEFLTVTRDEIFDFYKRMYVPNNMVFVVVGDIDKQQVVDQIARLWQDATPQPLPQITWPLEPPIDSQRTLTGKANIDKPRLRLAWPGTRLGGEGDYAMDLLATILGQGESSRLIRHVRDEQRLVNTIGAFNLSNAWGEGFFAVDAEIAPPASLENQIDPDGSGPTAIDQAKQAILAQIQRAQTQGVTPQELARAKRKTLASVIYHAQTAQALAGRMASDLITMKDPDYLLAYANAIQAITADQVQSAAQKYLNPDAMIWINLQPTNPGEKATTLKRPDDPTDRQTPQEQSVELDNEHILAQLDTGLTDRESAHRVTTVSPIQEHRLPNGLRVLICPSNRVPAVAIQMYHLGGLLTDQPGHQGIANATAAMAIKGTTTRTAQQIAQQIEDLGAQLSTNCGYNTSFSKALCLKEDWSQVLEILADVTLHPTFPDDQWLKMQPRLLAAIDRQTDTWNGELRQHFRQAYFGDHPWATPPLGNKDTVAQLTPDQLRDFHQQHLGASQAVLAVFGDIDPDQVIAQAKALFADMPEIPVITATPLTADSPTAQLLPVRTQKSLSAVQIGFGPGPLRSSSDYAALQVLARVLSSFPSGWLEQELRGRGPGLVYAVGAGQFTGLVPGYFSVLFNTQPSAIQEAIQRTMAVIDRACQAPIDDQTLARAKAKVLTDEFLYRQSNSDRATEAALNELYGLGLDEPQRFRRQVQELDAPLLQVIAQTYLRNPVAVVLTHQDDTDDQGLRKAMGFQEKSDKLSPTPLPTP